MVAAKQSLFHPEIIRLFNFLFFSAMSAGVKNVTLRGIHGCGGGGRYIGGGGCITAWVPWTTGELGLPFNSPPNHPQDCQIKPRNIVIFINKSNFV